MARRPRTCVDEALGARPTFVVVDARGLSFVDASGLAALVRARHASEAGVAFRVSEEEAAGNARLFPERRSPG
jgi:anti-anti-sigma regulatory factor